MSVDLTSPGSIWVSLEDGLPDPQFNEKSRAFMVDQLMRREDGLGNGDLFEQHQIEPVAGILKALGLACLDTEGSVASLIERMLHWDEIPTENKMFEMFGQHTAVKVGNYLHWLNKAGWMFCVIDTDTGQPIEGLSDEEFEAELNKKEVIV